MKPKSVFTVYAVCRLYKSVVCSPEQTVTKDGKDVKSSNCTVKKTANLHEILRIDSDTTNHKSSKGSEVVPMCEKLGMFVNSDNCCCFGKGTNPDRSQYVGITPEQFSNFTSMETSKVCEPQVDAVEVLSDVP